MRTGTDAAVGHPPAATCNLSRSPRASRSTTTTSAPSRRSLPLAGEPRLPPGAPVGNAPRTRCRSRASRPCRSALAEAAPGGSCGTTSASTSRCKRGGHYFYLHNDGTQNQSVLLVTEARCPGRGAVRSRTRRARMRRWRCPTSRRPSRAMWSPMRSRMAAPTGRSGASGASGRRRPPRHAALHQVLGRLLGARRLGGLLQPLSLAAVGQRRRCAAGRRCISTASARRRTADRAGVRGHRSADAHPRRP